MPPAKILPPDAVLRMAGTEDADGISLVLSEAFAEPWTPEKVIEILFADPQVRDVFIVEWAGEIVATASYQVQPSPDPDAAWVHWVGVRPAAQGHALGEIVTRQVIEQAITLGRVQVLLTTDDPRLAAIRTYLRLGFEPDLWHESHEDRWRKVLVQINR